MEVITLAGSIEGSKDGPANKAQFKYPQGIAIDGVGNIVVADTDNHRIRFINTKTGGVSTIAGSNVGIENGPIGKAQFHAPHRIAIDKKGNIFVADSRNNRIRFIDMKTGVVSTIAGSFYGFKDGLLEEARFNYPRGIAIDSIANIIVADTDNHRIRLINMKTRKVSTLAGSDKGFEDGDTLTEARFNYPQGIAIDGDGNIVVADTGNHKIRLINMKTGEVSTLTGSTKGFNNGPSYEAQFWSPRGIAIDGDGNIVVADTYNHSIRFINMQTREVTTLAGSTRGHKDGALEEAKFFSPNEIVIDDRGNIIVADHNSRIRMIKTKVEV